MLSRQEQRALLGKRVEALRKQKGMLQGELAKKAGFAGRASTKNCENSISGRLAVRQNSLNSLISIAKQIGKTKGLQGYIRLKSGRKSRRGLQARVFNYK